MSDAGLASQPKPKLLDRGWQVLRTRHYSRRREDACVMWLKRFILLHNKHHSTEIAEPEIRVFLTYLALKEPFSISTQKR
jgi:hypothetical protein